MAQRTFADGTQLLTVREDTHNHNAADAETRLQSLESSITDKLETLGDGAGTGEGMTLPKVGSEGRVKRIRAGDNVSISSVGEEVVISGGASTPQSGVYGEAYITTPAVTNISAANVSTKVAGTTTLGDVREFDDDGGVSNRLRYIGGFDTHVAVELTASVLPGVSASNTYEIHIVKNGVTIQSSTIERSLSGSAAGAVACHALTSCVNGDYFEAFVENKTSSANITFSRMNMMVTVSGGSTAGVDFVVSNKTELINAAASYAAGVITLSPGTYLLAGDINLETDTGFGNNDRIVMPAECYIDDSAALAHTITGNTTSPTPMVQSPAAGRWAVRNINLSNAGDGQVTDARSDVTAIGIAQGCTFTGLGKLLDVSSTGNVLAEFCRFTSGTGHIVASGAVTSITDRGCIHSGGTNSLHVEPGASVGELLMSQNVSVSAASNAAMLIEGDVGTLRFLTNKMSGAVYGLRLDPGGSLTALNCVANTLIAPSAAAAISGLAPSNQDPDGSVSSEFNMIAANLWSNAAGTSFVQLAESEPVASPQSVIQLSISADYTVTLADWQGLDPRKTALHVYIDGALSSVFVELDSALITTRGATVRITKQDEGPTGPTVAVSGGGVAIEKDLAGGTSTSFITLNSPTADGVIAEWSSDGAVWRRTFAPGNEAVRAASVGDVPSGHVLGRKSAGTGTGETFQVNDVVSNFQSPDASLRLRTVAPEDRQSSASLADAATFTATIPITGAGEHVDCTWLLEIASPAGSDPVAMTYFAKYRRTAAGAMSVQEERWLTDTVQIPVPTGVTVAAAVSADIGELDIANASGAAISVDAAPAALERDF